MMEHKNRSAWLVHFATLAAATVLIVPATAQPAPLPVPEPVLAADLIPRFNAERAKMAADVTRLDLELQDLQTTYSNADTTGPARDELVNLDQIVSNLRRDRNDVASKLGSATARGIEWSLVAAESKIAAKKSDLHSEQRAVSEQRREIWQRMESKRQELDLAKKGLAVVESYLTNLREDEERASRAAEINAAYQAGTNNVKPAIPRIVPSAIPLAIPETTNARKAKE